MKTSYTNLVLWGCICHATAVAGDYSQGPPNWQCTYPMKQQTCREIIKSWSEDHGQPVEDGIFVEERCSGCEPELVIDSSGEEQPVAYKCEKRNGRQVISSELDRPIVVYGEANSPDGWRIENWYFHKCARYWKCAEFCSLTPDDPRCFATSMVAFGRHIPITGDACSVEEDPPESPEFDPYDEPDDSSDQPESRDNTWEPVY